MARDIGFGHIVSTDCKSLGQTRLAIYGKTPIDVITATANRHLGLP